MQVDGTGSAAGGGGAVNNGFAQLDSAEFIKVLFTELQNQDPLKPQDTSKLLEQLSSLRNIESQLSLQEQLEDLVTQNQVASAGNLIGKKVAGLDVENNKVSGLVASVRVKDDEVILELDTGQRLKMSNVTAIAGAPVETAAASA